MTAMRRVLKGAIPSSIRPALLKKYHGTRLAIRKVVLDFQKEAVERAILSNRVGRGLYYRTISGAFSREQAAVAAGRITYRRALERDRASSFLLRRNVHRLEKGLIMPHRRKLFALDFIAETMDEFRAVAKMQAGQDMTPELRWARDVLAAYFDAVDTTHPKLAPLNAQFRQLKDDLTGPPAAHPSAPFVRDLTVQPVAVDALYQLSRRRRSVRSYRPDPVPRDIVDHAVAIGAQSPSACNRQAFHFLVFDDPDTAKKVAAVPAGTRSFVHNIPAVVVMVGHLSAYPRERDRHAIYVDASLAAMGFIYALEAQGVASCAINWADEEPAESTITRMLDLAPEDRVIMMISYGWPVDEAHVPYSAKRAVNEIRLYNPTIRG